MLNGFFSRIMIPAFLVTALFVFNACTKDDSNNTATAAIEITDGPIDDANVKAVFITVADIKIDGQSWVGFQGKTTFDLASYHSGITKLLGEGALEAKSYSQITLVLDTETDANGNAPGCYVLTAQNIKQKLEGGVAKTITVSGNFVAETTAKSTAIIDFDLRKALTYKSGSTTEFAFVTDAELKGALKLTAAASASTIKGTCTDIISGSEKIVVYAYKKGSFDVNVEKQGQGASQIQFANATASAVVAADGSYQISFLEKGDYELHCISYTDSNNDGKLEAKGELKVNVNGGINLLNLFLDISASLNLALVVTGVTLF